MNETDPASGGAITANCGTLIGDECGMKDPAQCSIHGPGAAEAGTPETNKDETMDAKALRQMIRRELAGALKEIRKENDVGDEPNADAPSEPLQKAYGHMKAASVFHKMAMDSHAKAMKAMDDVMDDKDEDPEESDGKEPPGAGDESDEERAALLAEIRRLST